MPEKLLRRGGGAITYTLSFFSEIDRRKGRRLAVQASLPFPTRACPENVALKSASIGNLFCVSLFCLLRYRRRSGTTLGAAPASHTLPWEIKLTRSRNKEGRWRGRAVSPSLPAPASLSCFPCFLQRVSMSTAFRCFDSNCKTSSSFMLPLLALSP